ncbi:MAG: hypothetical protein JJ714_05210 [Acidithiobacillus sp.]|nr:hypothetical protein [Acidithiobacillus sp.]
MKLKTWTPCTASSDGIRIEDHIIPWCDLPDHAETAPLVMIRTEARPSGWAAGVATVEQLTMLDLEAFTDGESIEALRPGQALRRGDGICWNISPEVGI